MAISKATSYPDYTFTGDNKNIPILFSGKLLEKLYDSTVLSYISNTDYIGWLR